VTDDATLSGPRYGWTYWARILIVNVIGGLAAFGLLGGFVADGPWSARWPGLLTSFVYANCVGTLAALAMPRIMRRVASLGPVTRWLTRLASISTLIVVGCAIASLGLAGLGLIRPGDYRAYMFGSLRISFIVGSVLIVGVTFYETLRGRLDAATVALRTKERDEADARRVAAEAQLAWLESRVNPHFLFNTLNSIAALTHEDPAGAERMTNQLASLMRSSLDAGSAALLPLGQEICVVRDYLEIERIRFGDRLRFTFDVPDDARERLVPRLSLQTLVENSVKFAVSPRREGGSIAVRAAVTDAGLRLEVEDDGPGFEPSFLPDGHGLALLKGRLAMTFGEQGRLDVDSRPGRTLVAIDIRGSV
jgi:two-component system, LytTR family, sensor histidine kinase AlgZ